MNREAAALGVPVYSVFRGHIGAVDRYLSAAGRLVLLESVDDVRTKIAVAHRPLQQRTGPGDSAALSAIVRQIAAIARSRRPSTSGRKAA
jgi:predicted glycosyltransferase